MLAASTDPVGLLFCIRAVMIMMMMMDANNQCSLVNMLHYRLSVNEDLLFSIASAHKKILLSWSTAIENSRFHLHNFIC